MTKDPIVQYFTGAAETYDEVIFRDKDYSAYDKIPSWILDQKQILPKQAKVLDLGCGTGLGARPFFAKGHKVTGIDITQAMIDKCQALPFDRLVCQSLEEPLPCGAASYDAAILIGVMEFITGTDRLFADISRVLVNGGLFGVTFPLKLSKQIEDKLEISTYTRAEIDRLCTSAGFKILRSEEFQGFICQNETVNYLGLLLRNVS